jgi:hypothetical protein
MKNDNTSGRGDELDWVRKWIERFFDKELAKLGLLTNSALTLSPESTFSTENKKNYTDLQGNSGVAKDSKYKSVNSRKLAKSKKSSKDSQISGAKGNFRVSRLSSGEKIEVKVKASDTVFQEQTDSQLQKKIISEAKLGVKILKYKEAVRLTYEELREIETLKHSYPQQLSYLNSSETSSETSSEPPSPVKKLFNPWPDKIKEKNSTSPATESFLELSNIKDNNKDLKNLKKLEEMHPGRFIYKDPETEFFLGNDNAKDGKGVLKTPKQPEQINFISRLRSDQEAMRIKQTVKLLNARFDSLRPASPFIFDSEADEKSMQTINDQIEVLLKAIEKYNNKIEENEIKKLLLKKEIEEFKKEKYPFFLKDKGSQKKLSEEKKSSDPSADPAPISPPRKLSGVIRLEG